MNLTYRHGDVLLIHKGDATSAAAPAKRRSVVLAKGELTGHAHRLSGVGITWKKAHGDIIEVALPNGGELRHEEHKTLVLSRGTYEVRRQNEWIPVGTSSRSVRVRD